MRFAMKPETRPLLRTEFHSCEQFVNGFISAIEQGNLPEFQNQYRNVDILIIDDVQFLREREQSQEEFFIPLTSFITIANKLF